ncbi:MAG: hypothetical protein HRT66_03170 [Flavobacteriaceae bacterium]|nr:hypothetical protein [Flavobacteriaceae bacterium]
MKVIYILMFFVLMGCVSLPKDNATYFGGNIINPVSNYVLLHNEGTADTIYLDKNGFFLKKWSAFKSDMYTFEHGYEYQNIYIDTSDSISIRLNPRYFDESLSFSGVGSDKNNFLIELYLQNEKDAVYLDREYLNMNEDDFLNKTDSLKAIYKNKYDILKESSEYISDEFNTLVNAKIDYGLGMYKEVYPFRHKWNFPREELSDQYYSFRENLEKPNVNVMDLLEYKNYMEYYFYYSSALKKLETRSLNIHMDMAKRIVNEVRVSKLKDYLLSKVMYNHLFTSAEESKLDVKLIGYYNDNSAKISSRVSGIIKVIKSTNANNRIGDFEIVNSKGRRFDVYDLSANKNTMIYFWTKKSLDVEQVYSSISKLKSSFPSLNIICINIDSEFYKTSNRKMRKVLKYFYNMKNSDQINEFVYEDNPRTILVDRNGRVYNSYSALESSSLLVSIKSMIKIK